MMFLRDKSKKKISADLLRIGMNDALTMATHILQTTLGQSRTIDRDLKNLPGRRLVGSVLPHDTVLPVSTHRCNELMPI